MDCPRCQLINPDTAKRCDCGFDFETKTTERSYLPRKKGPSKPKLVSAIVFGALLLVVQLIRIPELPVPFSPEAVGFDIAWVAVFALSIWLLWFGLRRRVTSVVGLSSPDNPKRQSDVRLVEPTVFAGTAEAQATEVLPQTKILREGYPLSGDRSSVRASLYRMMSNDELQQLSNQKDSLGDDARRALDSEMHNRGLGNVSVTGYSQNVGRRIFCNYCGVLNPHDARFCSSCGRVIVRFDKDETKATSVNNPEKSETKPLKQ
jgi:hypothetical protein